MPQFIKSAPSNPETLLRRLREVFPALQWQSYKYIDEGWDHEVIVLDDQLVFRFPNDDQYALRDEITVLRYLQGQVSIRIPAYSYVAPDYSFAGYPLIAGQPLQPEYFNSLLSADRTSIGRQLAGFLSTLHHLSRQDPALACVDLSDIKDSQAELKQQAHQYLLTAVSQADFACVQEILSEMDRLLAQSLPAVFLHGDIYYRHLLWEASSQQLGVIDFSDMNFGDPAFDFAELYEYGAGYVEEVYGYYSGPKDDSFLARAWTYQRWVGVFMMADHFSYHKTFFAEARLTFDRTKAGVAG